MKVLKAAILLGSIVFLAGLARAGAGDCPEAEWQDCNSNGRSDRYDLNPPYEFPDAQVYPLSGQPTAAIAEDLDADGAPDLALNDREFRLLSIFLNRSGAFEKTQDLPLDGDPRCLAAADFDRDGDFDLAVGGARPGTDIPHCIWILANRGDGVFSVSRVVPVAWYPSRIEAEDLDADGFPDLAFASSSSSSNPPSPADGAWIAWNRGGGSFEESQKLVSGNMKGIAAADLDGDSRLDLAMVEGSESLGWITVSRNRGGRRFEDSPARYLVTRSPTCIVPIDVDRDGKLDLVTGQYDRPRAISILINAGLGAFGEVRQRRMRGSPGYLMRADLKGDGFGELVAQLLMPLDSTEIIILETRGGEDFSGENRIWAEGGVEERGGLAAADFNGDGRVDLAAMAVHSFLVFYNVPGNPRSQDCNSNCIPDECETDCNRNGLLDSCDIAQGISKDCDSDGVPDECARDCNWNGIPDACDIDSGASQDCDSNRIPDECEVERWDCDRNGVLDACQEDCDGDLLPDVCEILEGTAADCNGNGRIDACEVAQGESQDCNANGVPDGCELMAAPGFGGPRGFWVGPTLSSAPVGDFDGDGDLDFAALETGYQDAPGRISLLLNEGKGTFSYRPVDPGFSSKPVVGTAGDFGGDGSTDLAVATDGPPRIVVLINKKGGAMEPAGFAQIEAHPVSIAAHDLDGDGDLDLCAAAIGSAQGGSVWVLRNLGGGSLEAAAEIPLAGLPASIAAADLDLDGRPDLAVARSRGGEWQTGGILVLWGRGSGEFESPAEIPGSAFSAALSSPSSLTAGDLNGDGLPDLVLALGSVLRVFFLQEGRLSWRTMDIPSAFWATAVVAADLDGDGDLDLAFLSSRDDLSVISVLSNRPGPMRDDLDGNEVPDECEAIPPPSRFKRGDANADGTIDLSDAILLLGHLFLGEKSPDCLDAADADGSGTLNITDAIYSLNFLFLGGSAPRAPFPHCGFDPKINGLDCAAYPGCT